MEFRSAAYYASNTWLICLGRSRWALSLGGALFLCALPLPAQQRQANFQLCYPSTTWFGAPAPVIDGQIGSDPGWRGAFRYVFGNGTTSPDVIVQGIRDSSNLYLAIQANNLDTTLTAAPDFYQSTMVVLAFDPGNGIDSQTGDTTRMQRIHIFPIVANATDGYRGSVFETEYWSGGLSTWNSPGSTSTAWLQSANVKAGYDKDPMTGRFSWSLEMKLPISGNLSTGNPLNGLVIPDSGFFGFYVDVFRVVKVGNNATFLPTYWPTVAPEPGCTVGSCTPDSQTPSPALWGNSTRDPAQVCGGVSVGSQNNDIRTNNTPNSRICIISGVTTGDGSVCPASPNVFTAIVHNTSVDGSGAPQTAHNVQATFLISHWGIPSQWDVITPLANNPSAAVNLNPGDTPLSTASWFPVPNSSNFDPNVPGSHPHQCIMVKLDATGATGAPGTNTVFLNNTAVQNMDFVSASAFKREAEISAKGYPLPPDRSDQVFDLRLTTREEVLRPDQVAAAYSQSTAPAYGGRGKAGRVISQLTWILEGCRRTGRFMTIKEQRLEICDGVGAFGYVIRHEGKRPVEKWDLQLTGHGLEKVSGTENSYTLQVPQDGVAAVTTRAEPKEQTSAERNQDKAAVFFDAGPGIPHGTFASGFNVAFSFNAGLEYIATSHFSAEGIFGYQHFPAPAGNASDIYQFSVNGKVYLTSGGSLRPFLNAGIGGYKFSPGSTYVGGNFGAGILYHITANWGLQGSYNFHAVNTPAAATKFSTLQAGIRLAF